MDNWKNKTNGGEKKLPNREQKLQVEYAALMVLLCKNWKIDKRPASGMGGKCFTADWEVVNQTVLPLCKHLTATSLCKTQIGV